MSAQFGSVFALVGAGIDVDSSPAVFERLGELACAALVSEPSIIDVRSQINAVVDTWEEQRTGTWPKR